MDGREGRWGLRKRERERKKEREKEKEKKRERSITLARGCEVGFRKKGGWLGRRYKSGRWALGMWDRYCFL